jgi:hypothetical protein
MIRLNDSIAKSFLTFCFALGYPLTSYIIGKTPKKLDSICCPHAEKLMQILLKQLRPIGKGDQELDKKLVWEELI